MTNQSNTFQQSHQVKPFPKQRFKTLSEATGIHWLMMIAALAVVILMFTTGCKKQTVYQPSVAELTDKAQAMMKSGDTAGAVSRLEAARDLMPEEPKILYNLGVAYQADGKLDESIGAFEKLQEFKAIEDLNPLKITRSLGVVYEAKADKLVKKALDGKTAQKAESAEEKKKALPQDKIDALMKEAVGFYDKSIDAFRVLQEQDKSTDPEALSRHISDIQQRVSNIESGKIFEMVVADF